MVGLREFRIASSSTINLSFARACLMPSQVKKGTRKSIATIGTLSGAEAIVQS